MNKNLLPLYTASKDVQVQEKKCFFPKISAISAVFFSVITLFCVNQALAQTKTNENSGRIENFVLAGGSVSAEKAESKFVKLEKVNAAIPSQIKSTKSCGSKSSLVVTNQLREEILQRLQRDKKITLDLFVMSKCPYGVMAEEALMKLLDEYGDKIELRLNFIANEELSNGHIIFNSLHGQTEVDEDIRQLIIARDYPEKLWLYLEARSKIYSTDNWEIAANKAGIDVEILKIACTGLESQKLLGANINKSRAIGITASPTLMIDKIVFKGSIFDAAPVSTGTFFHPSHLTPSSVSLLIYSPFPAPLIPPVPSPPAPVSACATGTDPYSGSPYVVCSATPTMAWISANTGGTYHPLIICNSLGYANYGSYGGTCGNVCGYCTSPTSCSSPGSMVFDGAGLGSDAHGVTLGSTVQWQCVSPSVGFNGGSPQSLVVCQSSGATSINSLLTATGPTGATFTWTVTSSPAHGTLGGFPATASSGTSISPTGTSYTPTSGYSGADAFTIQVSNGTSTATTTINVTVNPAPVAITTASATATFSYTGSLQFFTVPAGVSSVSVKLWGAQGGQSEICGSTLQNDGGLGGYADGALSVSPGQVLNVYVGGEPSTTIGVGSTVGGFNGGGISGQYGGGGGGASDIRVGGTGYVNRVIVAGGGGGGNTGCPDHGTGGAGGGLSGSTGINLSGGFTPGGGGTQVGGGTAGSPGNPGNVGLGGDGNSYHEAGGGGGYYGGGSAYAAGGGGGSSYLGGVTGGTTASGIRSGNGLVTIAYSLQPYVCVGGTTTLTEATAGGTWSTLSSNVTLAGTATTSVTVTGITAGTANITYTLATGCYVYATVTVNAAPTVTATGASYCPGASGTLNASGATTYTWSPSAGLSATTGASVTVTTTVTATTYTVTGTNAAGCSNTATATVTVNPLPSLTATGVAYCTGLSGTLNASGATTYTWSPATGLSATTGSSVTVSTTVTATTYTVTGTSTCSVTATATVTVNPLPSFTVSAGGPTTFCSGGSVTLYAGGTTAYINSPGASGSTTRCDCPAGYAVTGYDSRHGSWLDQFTLRCKSLSNGVVSGSGVPTCSNGVSTGGAGDGPYFFTGNNVMVGMTMYTSGGHNSGLQGFGQSAAYVAAQGSNSSAPASVTLMSAGGSVLGSAYVPNGNVITGMYTYNNFYSDGVAFNYTPVWAFNTGGISWSNSATTSNITVTTSGTYTATITDNNGCSYTPPGVTVTLINPTVSVTPNPATICSGNSIALTASGAVTYTWSPSTGLSSTTGASVTANPTITTIYTVTGTTSGCSGTTTIQVSVNANPTSPAPGNTSPACIGGFVTLNANPVGSGPFTYSWAGPSGFASGLANPGMSGVTLANAGNYTVTVTNTSGCSSRASTTVTVDALPTTSPTNTSPVCVGGTLNLNAVATAVRPITYSWTGPSGFTSASATPSITGVSFGDAGIYICNVTTSGSGCTATSTTAVSINPTPGATPANSSPVCTGGPVTLFANPSGGASIFSWTGPSGFSSTVANPIITPPSGTNTYSLTVSSGIASGCSPTTILTTVVTVNVTPTPIVAGGSGAATFSYTGSLQSYTVPAGVTTMTITASGAQGGNISSHSGATGGAGANMSGVFTVSPGDILNIISGGAGQSALYTGGGGGGSFVWDVTAGNTLLIAAGGGGGAGCSDNTGLGINGLDATTASNGISGVTMPNGGGIGGSGGTVPTGSIYDYAAGGAGWLTNGANGTYISFCSSTTPIGGSTPLSGGAGGAFGGTSGLDGNGGFGGGGGGHGRCGAIGGGGGGGYSGGGAGGELLSTVNTFNAGGGGGSYNIGASQSNSVGNTGNGFVTISYSLPPASICVGATTTLSTTPSGGTWSSSNPALATVGSSTGIVTGVAAGTPNITYTLPTGCFATIQVTVNSTPSSIGGTFAVCNGASTTLSNTVGGGVWSSSNTGVATIGSSSGYVTGASAGNTTITYTLSSGCSTTAAFTVNANPSSITGAAVACTGTSVAALSSTPGGGTWTSGNTGMATIGSSSGVITGISSGNPTISYTVSSGCFTTVIATINPSPASVTGAGSICAGSTLTLADASAGGVWTSLSPGIATVGTGSGVVTGISNGNAVIVYTLPGGCFVTATVTVNGLPTAISGTSSGCLGFTSTLSSTPGGGTWTSSNALMATIGSSSGAVTTLSVGNPIITYSTGTGCFTTATLTINPNPSSITGVGSVCSGSSTALADATSGGTWSSGTTSVATVGSVTGMVIGVSAGTSNIVYSLPSGCSSSFVVTVNAAPTAIGGTLSGCVGFTTTLNCTPSGGAWTSSSTALATIGSSSGAVTTLLAGTPIISYTASGACTTTATLTINTVPASIAGSSSVCLGGIASLTDPSFGGTWSSANPAVASVGSATGVVTGTGAGSTTISYTISSGCAATMPFTVNPLPSLASGSLNVCVGLTTTLNCTPGGGTWTSSNTGVATVGSASGIVSGVSAGTAALTYSTGIGCYFAGVVTVNPNPAANTGIATVCVGLTTTLANTASGGTWSSSNTSLATVGSASGAVTGAGAGVPVISYTLPTGCYATTPVTVNPLPANITGTLNVCAGLTTTVNCTTTGGSWSSSNTGVATIGSSTGVVSGIASGTTFISYTIGTGCYSTAVLTVNTLPAAITGLTGVCTGFTITLSDASAGGTWSSSSAAALAGSATGVITGVTAGTATVTYTLPTGCITTRAITVNATPTAITGTPAVCVGLTTTLNSTPSGGTWASSNTSEATVAGGVVTGASAGTPTISYTLSTGCNVYQQITVNALPSAISGSAVVCAGSTTTLSSSPTGGNWASSTGAATVGSASGVVTGVSSGNPVITYTLPTGCINTVTATVNPLPSAITGTLNVCAGSTTALSSSPGGGTWTSSNTAEATVGTAGTVTGVTAGTPTISYALSTGCLATATVTVNALPASITGTVSVCVGASSALGDATLGGTWSSGASSLASVGSLTGIITGVATGNPVISYILSTGCFSTVTATVNPVPASITGGVTPICPGATTSLSDITGGGSWSSSNTTIATVGSTGIVTGVAAGTVNISYTLSAGCFATTPVSVNAAPNISSFTVSSATAPCLGGGSVVTVTSISIGSGTYTGTYNLSGANTATGSSATITMGSSSGTFNIPSTSLGASGSTVVTLTSITNGTGCSATLSSGNTAAFNVNALPTVYTVTGGGSYCSGSAAPHVFLSGSTVGVNYQLMLAGSPVGSPFGGTSSAIDFGAQTTAGTYTVVATNGTTSCTSNMTGSATVTVNPLPSAFTVTGGGSYCAGGTGVAVGLSGSQPGVNYRLYNAGTAIGSSVAGTGSSISFGLQTLSGAYSVTATNATTSCALNMTGSASIVINPLPSAFTGPLSVCVGLTTPLGASPTGGTWSSASTGIATIGSSTGVVTGVASGNSVISYTLSTGCFTTGTFTVNPLPLSITGTTNVCTGSTASLSDLTSGGAWSSSNISQATVGSTGTVTGVAAGVPTISYTLPTGCFATAAMTVNATPAAIAGAASVCTGSNISLTDVTTGGAWSSSTAQATVGSATGIVTGVSSGTPVITYTLPAGSCFAVYPITVNQTPNAITGTTNVCNGFTTALSDATSGGAWSSSNAAIATVGTSGTVSGLLPGSAVISYTMPTGCGVSATITVNTVPAAITGASGVCAGSSTALADATPGGSWSSSSGIATVGSGTGIVTGVSAGTVNISYSLSAGCTAVFAMTVNSAVATITGTASACVGLSSTLSTTSTGGTWSSSNPALAVAAPSTGVVTGIATGTPVISYVTSAGCFATIPFTVNPLPAAITGLSTVCTGLTTTLADVSAGGTWTSASTGVASVGSLTGIVTGSSSGTTTISYTLPTGCLTTTGVTVNTSPSTISGGSSVCIGSSISLTDLVAGGTWTSSNPALATIGSSSGVVTGVSAGTPVITYTLPSGCFTTAVVTVNTLPASISGTFTACQGNSATLLDATTGGAWTSSNTAIATIGSASGSLSAVAAGTVTITYTLPTACFATTPFTVNPLPSAISGTSSLCAGASGTLTDATSGGSWSTSNFSIATVGSSGAVNAVSAGTATITYTLPTGCFATIPFTVNPLPSGITGTPVVCVSATTALADAASGGSWSSSNTSVATIGSSTGVAIGVSAGTLNFTYTLTTGCYTLIAGTVNALPALFTVTGGGGFCAGGSGVHVGLSGSAIGFTYQLYNGATAYGSPLTGTGLALDFGLITTPGTFTVVATNSSTGCYVTMTGSATVFGTAVPTAYTMTGGGSYCAGGTGVTVGLSSSQTGISYQLLNGALSVGTAVTGTGLSLSFGLQTVAGTYTVRATNLATGCTSLMTGTSIISVNPLPVAYTVTGGGSYCSGTSGVHIGLGNSTVGVNYQLFRGGTIAVGAPMAGTGAPLDFGLFTTAGTYTVIATDATSACAASMTGSAVVSVNTAPSAYTVSGGGSYCAGGSGLAVLLSNSNTGVAYQLYNGSTAVGSVVAGTGSGFSFGSQTAAGVYTVIATNPLTGCAATMTGSATISVNPLPVAFTVTGGGSYCSGGSGALIGLGGSQSGYTYQLYLGSTLVTSQSGTGSAISFGTFTTAGTYTVTATSSSSCSSNMAGSANISVNPLPTVFAVTGGGGYCTGGSGVLVGLASSQPGVNYQLFNGGVAVGTVVPGTGVALSFGYQTTAGASYTVSATDAVTGCSTTMSGSASVTVNSLPAAYSVTGGGSYCAGGTGIAVGLSASQPGVNYQLFIGSVASGSPVAGTGSAITFGLQTSFGSYTVAGTNSSTGCTASMTGSVSVSSVALPAVYAVTGGGSFCAGGSGAVIGLSGSQTGVSYQLYNSSGATGSAVAGTGGAISFGAFSVAGTYTAVATSTATSCTNNMSGAAVITVNTLPSAYAVTGGGNYCTGGSGVHVGLGNSDIGVVYQLYRGSTAVGAPVSGAGIALDFGLQTVAGTYTVNATSVATGCVNSMTGSVAVSVVALPTVYTVTGGGSYCSGGSGIAVGLSGSQSGVSYQLQLSGAAVGSPVSGTGSAISFGLQTLGGTYTVAATNSSTACTSAMAGSAAIVVNPLPTVYTVTGGGTFCTGGSGIVVGLTGSQVGVNYQLYFGLPSGAPIPGTGSAISFGLQTSVGTYTVVGLNTVTGCSAGMSGSASVTLTTPPAPVAVTGGGSYCAGGAGVHVGLAGSATGVNYQLYRGGSPVGSPLSGVGSSLDFGFETVAGTYTVIATNALTGCTASMTGSATVSINSLPGTYAVTGGGSYCSGGSGVNVGLSGSASGVQYQLYRGSTLAGSAVSGTGSSLNFGLQTTGGTYTVVATNATSLCTSAMTGSVSVSVNPLPAVYTVTGGGSYCTGGAGLHVGLSASAMGVQYQLFRGITTVGSPLAGTGLSLDFGIQTVAGTYTVTATNATTGCTGSMTGSATITINLLPTAYAVTGGGSFCSGGLGSPVGLASSQVGVNYQLYRGGVAVGLPVPGTGSIIDFGYQTIGGTYTVVATNTATSCTNTMTGSAVVTVNALPTAYTVSGGGTYCSGGAGLHILLSSSATGISYRLFLGSSAVGTALTGTGAGLDFGAYTTSGTYTVQATNTTTSCVSSMTGSATITGGSVPYVFTVTGGGSFCTGGSGYAVGLSGSTGATAYQLYRGASAIGSPVTGTGAPLTFGVQTVAGGYTVVATNTSSGCTANMSGSATITVYALPTVYTVTGGGSYCAGGSGVHVGISGSDVAVNYQLLRGSTHVGSPVAGTGLALDFGLQTTAGTYTVTATSASTSCTSNMTGSATVSTLALPVAGTISGPVSVHNGSTITLSETVSGGTWSTSNSHVTVGGTTGIVTGVSAGAVTISYAVSNSCGTAYATYPITEAGPAPMPKAGITSGNTVICVGATSRLSNSIAGGTWTTGDKNIAVIEPQSGVVTGLSAGIAAITYTLMNSAGTDQVYTPVIVNAAPDSVIITAKPGENIAAGEKVSLQAAVVNGSPVSTYEWLLNNKAIQGATAATFTSSSFSNNDVVSCHVTGQCGGQPLIASVNIVVAGDNTAQVVPMAGGDIRVVPNPNKGTFVIKGSLGTAMDEEVSIEITDVLGQVVFTDRFIANGGQLNKLVQLGSSTANGMYLLTMRSGAETKVFHIVVEQ